MAFRRHHWLLILCGITLLAVIAAGLSVSFQRQAHAPQFESQLAFGSLESDIEKIRGIRLKESDQVLTIERQDSHLWAIVERNHFPARIDVVRELILGLADLTYLEKKTAREDWHHHLGLVAPEDGGTGLVIEVWDEAGVRLADLILGAALGAPDLEGRTHYYVRRSDQPQTYVARGSLDVVTDIDAWLDMGFAKIERSRIARGQSISGGFQISRDTADDYNFTLSGVPEGFEPSSEAAGNGLGSALSSLEFQDVRLAEDLDFSSGSKVSFETFDGLGIEVDVVRTQDKYWIKIRAQSLKGENDGGRDVGQGLTLSAAQEAEQLNRRASGWAFQVPEWKGDQLSVRLESLIRKIGEDDE